MKKYLYLLSLLSITACSSPDTINTVTTVDTPVFHPSPPPQMVMLPFEIQVMNLEKLKALVSEAEKNNKTVVLVTLTLKDYENISLNLQELKRYIRQQDEIIKYYKNISQKPKNKS